MSVPFPFTAVAVGGAEGPFSGTMIDSTTATEETSVLSEEWKDLGPADLAPGKHRGVKLSAEEFVLIANVEGEYHAIDDWCNHAGCMLSSGDLEGDLILCPCHYAEFSVKTGVLESLPRICDDQTRYELRVEGGRIQGKRLPEPEPSF